MADDWDHPITPNTLAAVNKAGLREFYELIRRTGGAGPEVAIAVFRTEVLAMFEDLKRQVAENRTVVDSAVAMIAGLKEQLKSASASLGDPEELRSIIADLDKQESDLAAAVAVNTVAEPEVPPAQVEEILSQPAPADTPSAAPTE